MFPFVLRYCMLCFLLLYSLLCYVRLFSFTIASYLNLQYCFLVYVIVFSSIYVFCFPCVCVGLICCVVSCMFGDMCLSFRFGSFYIAAWSYVSVYRLCYVYCMFCPLLLVLGVVCMLCSFRVLSYAIVSYLRLSSSICLYILFYVCYSILFRLLLHPSLYVRFLWLLLCMSLYVRLFYVSNFFLFYFQSVFAIMVVM